MYFSIYAKKDEPVVLMLPFYGYDNRPLYCMTEITVTDERNSLTDCSFKIDATVLMIEESCEGAFTDGPLHITVRRADGYQHGIYQITVKYHDNILTRLAEWIWCKVHAVPVEVIKF